MNEIKVKLKDYAITSFFMVFLVLFGVWNYYGFFLLIKSIFQFIKNLFV